MARSKYSEKEIYSQTWGPLSDWRSTPEESYTTTKYGWSDQLIIDRNNGPAFRGRKPGSINDIGGNFHVVKREFDQESLGPLHLSNSADPMAPGGPHYYGEITAGGMGGGLNTRHPNPPPVDWALLKRLGTKAIAATVPTAPKANLATFLAEAREGIPKAVMVSSTGQRRTRRCLNAGDEYLNVEFGWKPLVADVTAFAHAVVNSEKLLADYHANSGRTLRRRYSFPPEMSVSEVTGSWSNPGPVLLSGSLYGSEGQQRAVETTTKVVKRWFVASYRYFIPPVGTPQRYLSDAHHLLGVKLTPEVLWEAAPWSWAVDWATNTGDVMKNVSAFQQDGLVMPHAYVMEETTITKERVWRGSEKTLRSYPKPFVLKDRFTTVQKVRQRATPYGFSATWEGLSARQLAILGALGISRY